MKKTLRAIIGSIAFRIYLWAFHYTKYRYRPFHSSMDVYDEMNRRVKKGGEG